MILKYFNIYCFECPYYDYEYWFTSSTVSLHQDIHYKITISRTRVCNSSLKNNLCICFRLGHAAVTAYDPYTGGICSVDVLGRATWTRVLMKSTKKDSGKHESSVATRERELLIYCTQCRETCDCACMREYQSSVSRMINVNGHGVITVIGVRTVHLWKVAGS